MQIDFSKPATYAMMGAMAIPEQLVMLFMAPNMPLVQRLMVSVVMYLSHFMFNGFVTKAPTMADEFKWIIPTALFGAFITKNPYTGLLLAAADTTMTVVLRGN